jgi:isopentenyldiphosphate isomerase
MNNMEEYVDILYEVTGVVTGNIISKKEAHKTGIWHGSVHIWIISEDKKRILLQKRCADKDLFPNMWDISVGGHISAGEDSLISAKRELSEELGLNPEEFDFMYVDRVKEKFEYEDILSNEFVTIYKIISDVNIDNLDLQKEEVSEARWFTKEELSNLRNELKVIPHIEEFDMIYNILGD